MKIIIRMLILNLIMLFSTLLYAGCWKSELAGRWQVLSLTSFEEASFCDFRISTNGDILSNGGCIDYFNDSENEQGPIIVGHFELKGDCSITGSLNVDGSMVTVQKARMSSTRNEISGIFTLFDTSGVFNVIRSN